MQNLTELNQFDATVPYVEITDPVLGGTGGESNAAITALANRTRFLYNAAGGFTDVVELTAGTALTTTHLRNLIYINVAGNAAFTLAALSNFNAGQCLTIKVKCPQGKCVSFTPNGAEELTNGQTTKTIEWLCDGEEITFVKRSTTQWEIVNALGNFDKVGNDALVRLVPKNSAIAIGQEVNRLDYARIWAEVEATAVSEATWLSNALSYRCFFSTGDGVSTFRFPDMRAMHWRALDLGRGVDLSGIGSTAGSFGNSGIEEHYHTTNLNPNSNDQVGFGKIVTGNSGAEGSFPLYKSSGALDVGNNSIGKAETTVKRAGLTPVIYY